MVAVKITDTGVECDALASVTVHPAAELFPLMQGAEFAELVADIVEFGQRDPIVLTPDGQLLDGRNRWRACSAAGLAPVTRVESGEPWSYVISTNVHRRHLNESQRAWIATRIAERTNGERRRPASPIGEADPRKLPPTRSEAARLLNVGTTSIDRARTVRRHGTDSLQRAVETGDIPVYTAARVAREMSPEKQDEFVQRVNYGADPKKIAPAAPAPRQAAPVTPRATSHGKQRHQHVGATAVEQIQHALDALGLVIDSAPDGLDPSITSEQAGQLLTGLSKSAAHHRRLIALLRARKESTT